MTDPLDSKRIAGRFPEAFRRWASRLPAPREYGAILRKPLAAGALAGAVAFLLWLALLPPVAPQGDDSVTVVIAAGPPSGFEPEEDGVKDGAEDSPDPDPSQAAAPVRQETAPPPSPAVPVVAQVAVVVSDMGLNRRVTQAALETLPQATSIAVSAYATDPAATAATFRNTNHDVWLQLAAQSTAVGIDSGPLAMSFALRLSDNKALLDRQIAQMPGLAIGVFVPPDADITGDAVQWAELATGAMAANLMVLDATKATVPGTLYMQGDDQSISTYLKAELVVAGDTGPAALQKALDATVPVLLRRREGIIVLTRPTMSGVRTLAAWLKGLENQGIALVPASQFTGLKP